MQAINAAGKGGNESTRLPKWLPGEDERNGLYRCSGKSRSTGTQCRQLALKDTVKAGNPRCKFHNGTRIADAWRKKNGLPPRPRSKKWASNRERNAAAKLRRKQQAQEAREQKRLLSARASLPAAVKAEPVESGESQAVPAVIQPKDLVTLAAMAQDYLDQRFPREMERLVLGGWFRPEVGTGRRACVVIECALRNGGLVGEPLPEAYEDGLADAWGNWRTEEMLSIEGRRQERRAMRLDVIHRDGVLFGGGELEKGELARRVKRERSGW